MAMLALLLSTTGASTGTALEARQISDLPLNLRRASSLALLVPAVSDTSGNSLTSASGNAPDLLHENLVIEIPAGLGEHVRRLSRTR